MIHKIIRPFPKLLSFTWNYSESGHGKGSADGVGGTVKRTCDRVIARGEADIVNFEDFNRVVEGHISKVRLISISGDRDEDLKSIVKELQTLKGE